MAAFSTSCKDKDESTKKYLDGSLKMENICPIQKTGATVKVVAGGVTHPKGNRLYVSYSLAGKKDTLDVQYDPEKTEFDVRMPEEVGDYTLSVIVFPEDASDYYSSSTSASLTVVDPERSVPEVLYDPNRHNLLRDSRISPVDEYPYVTVGGVDWMCQNLRYPKSGVSYYSDCMDKPWGRFYTWEEAKTACPAGWSLPGDIDFVNLAENLNPGGDYVQYSDFAGAAGSFMVHAAFNGKTLWPYNPTIVIPSEALFMAIPAGYVNRKVDSNFKYSGFESYAMFWTKDSNPDDPGQAMYRYISLDSNILMSGSADKASASMSVRCIRK